MRSLLITLFSSTSFFLFAQQKEISLEFDLSQTPVEYSHYWKSTGYSPAKMTVNKDFKMYLNMLKAARGNAIEYMRPHYLLNHVKIKNVGTPQQSYDFTELDEILDLLVEADLKLIFEIMWHKDPYFNDWYDTEKLDYWYKYIKALVLHLQEQYGKETVETWYFENINEPDIHHFWRDGVVQFLHYWDATYTAIKDANPKLKFGGPGTAKGMSHVYQTFIEHIDEGYNLYTKQKNDVSCDFFTWHIKERPFHMVENEQEVIKWIKKTKNEKLINTPIGNDEADPLAGWGNAYWWRPLPWYGTFTVQAVDVHNQILIDKGKKNYWVLSNDNAFMGDWYRRTHVARFIPGDNSVKQKNSSLWGGGWVEGADKRPETNAFYLVKKPDFTSMMLMAYQGNKRFQPKGEEIDSSAGAIVSQNEKQEYIILAYNKPSIDIDWSLKGTEPRAKDNMDHQRFPRKLNINLQNVKEGTYKVIKYRMDETYGNPYGIWQNQGSKDDPSNDEFLKLLKNEDPALISTSDEKINGSWNTSSSFKTSGIELIYLAKKPQAKPASITDLEYHTYNGLNKEKVTMLNWKHNDELHIKSFDVYYAPLGEKKFTKVNQYDVTDRGFQHLNESEKGGSYKIMAIDHWGRKSVYSKTITVK